MPEGTPAMLALWGVAAAWTVLGIVGALHPKRVAIVVGPLVALYAPLAAGQGGDVGMWLGLATGIALVVASVVLHETVLLGFGAIGVFGFTLMVLVRLFGGTAGMPIALFTVGVLVLVVAVVLARRATRTGPRSPS